VKNKKTTYILLPVVLLIWGAIVYKVFFANATQEEDIAITAMPMQHAAVSDSAFSFTIQNNYRDPFLSHTYVARSKPVQKKAPKPKEPKKIEQPKVIVWPKVEYMGTVEGKDAKFGLVLIDNATTMVAEGDRVKKIDIIKIYADSIRLKNADIERTFLK